MRHPAEVISDVVDRYLENAGEAMHVRNASLIYANSEQATVVVTYPTREFEVRARERGHQKTIRSEIERRVREAGVMPACLNVQFEVCENRDQERLVRFAMVEALRDPVAATPPVARWHAFCESDPSTWTIYLAYKSSAAKRRAQREGIIDKITSRILESMKLHGFCLNEAQLRFTSEEEMNDQGGAVAYMR